MSNLDALQSSRHCLQPSLSSLNSQENESFLDRVRRPSISSGNKSHTFHYDHLAPAHSNYSKFRNQPLLSPLPLDARHRDYDGARVEPAEETHSSFRFPISFMIPRHSHDDDAASVHSFTCSLSKEFDRQRNEIDVLSRNNDTLEATKKQAYLDSTFSKLTTKYRAKQPEPRSSSKNNTRYNHSSSHHHGILPTADKQNGGNKAKQHFLDLSCIIRPLPQENDDNDKRQHEQDGRTCRQPMFPINPDFRLGRPLQPSLAVNVERNPHQVSAKMSTNGRPSSATLEDENHFNPLSLRSHAGGQQIPTLRPRRSLENPSGVRRKQKEEWNASQVAENDATAAAPVQVPQLPEWARRQNMAMVKSASATGYTASAPMVRGSSSSSINLSVSLSSSVQSMVRPRLPSRTSSSALRHQRDRQRERERENQENTPPLVLSSRESFSSSNGSDSLPQTPVSTTYQRGLAIVQSPPRAMREMHRLQADEKEYVCDLFQVGMDTESATHLYSEPLTPVSSPKQKQQQQQFHLLPQQRELNIHPVHLQPSPPSPPLPSLEELHGSALLITGSLTPRRQRSFHHRRRECSDSSESSPDQPTPRSSSLKSEAEDDDDDEEEKDDEVASSTFLSAYSSHHQQDSPCQNRPHRSRDSSNSSSTQGVIVFPALQSSYSSRCWSPNSPSTPPAICSTFPASSNSPLSFLSESRRRANSKADEWARRIARGIK